MQNELRRCCISGLAAELRCRVAGMQAAQLGIIFAAVSELATDQTIMQQLSDPNSNSQAYFIATAFLATAATFIPRFVGGEQPEDREQSVWTATAELANGRVRFLLCFYLQVQSRLQHVEIVLSHSLLPMCGLRTDTTSQLRRAGCGCSGADGDTSAVVQAAMIGFAALLGYEYVTKTPFF